MAAGPRVLLVEARFYTEISDALAQGALAALAKVDATVDRIAVPGALEIPGAIALAAASGRYDAYVALGCIIRGETYHFEIVANESARGIMDLTVRENLAIGNGILTTENFPQAWARAKPGQGDKGGGAAQAALALLAHKRALGLA
jgi:6,7-dimethyl-8-ribityllumazine synthase